MGMERKFTVVLHEEEGGGYSAQCIELPGAVSQGETREAALVNIKEAIECYLEARAKLMRRRLKGAETVEVTL